MIIRCISDIPSTICKSFAPWYYRDTGYSSILQQAAERNGEATAP
jgi:hypothetical protein